MDENPVAADRGELMHVELAVAQSLKGIIDHRLRSMYETKVRGDGYIPYGEVSMEWHDPPEDPLREPVMHPICLVVLEGMAVSEL